MAPNGEIAARYRLAEARFNTSHIESAIRKGVDQELSQGMGVLGRAFQDLSEVARSVTISPFGKDHQLPSSLRTGMSNLITKTRLNYMMADTALTVLYGSPYATLPEEEKLKRVIDVTGQEARHFSLRDGFAHTEKPTPIDDELIELYTQPGADEDFKAAFRATRKHWGNPDLDYTQELGNVKSKLKEVPTTHHINLPFTFTGGGANENNARVQEAFLRKLGYLKDGQTLDDFLKDAGSKGFEEYQRQTSHIRESQRDILAANPNSEPIIVPFPLGGVGEDYKVGAYFGPRNTPYEGITAEMYYQFFHNTDWEAKLVTRNDKTLHDRLRHGTPLVVLNIPTATLIG